MKNSVTLLKLSRKQQRVCNAVPLVIPMNSEHSEQLLVLLNKLASSASALCVQWSEGVSRV